MKMTPRLWKTCGFNETKHYWQHSRYSNAPLYDKSSKYDLDYIVGNLISQSYKKGREDVRYAARQALGI